MNSTLVIFGIIREKICPRMQPPIDSLDSIGLVQGLSVLSGNSRPGAVEANSSVNGSIVKELCSTLFHTIHHGQFHLVKRFLCLLEASGEKMQQFR